MTWECYCGTEAETDGNTFCTRCGGRVQTKPGRHAQIDQQWYAAIPYGWGNPKMGWGSDRQERGDRDMHSGEQEMLYDILDEDEDIKALVGGSYRAEQDTVRTSKHRGVAVATDKRVIFLDKGVFGSTDVSEMPYRSIEGLTHSTGMMFGGVQVTGLGMAGWRIEDVKPKESARPFADTVRGLIEAYHARAKQISTGNTDADELKKWAALLKDGTITQDEFDLKKKQLLGL